MIQSLQDGGTEYWRNREGIGSDGNPQLFLSVCAFTQFGNPINDPEFLHRHSHYANQETKQCGLVAHSSNSSC